MECNVDCDADILLCYDWLRAHDLAFLCERLHVGPPRPPGPRCKVRLDLTLDVAASPATRLSHAEPLASARSC